MAKTVFVIMFCVVLGLWCPAHGQNAQDKWHMADLTIKRLPPKAFPQLLGDIVRNLEKRGCTIPQSFVPTPHNVILGEFTKKD